MIDLSYFQNKNSNVQGFFNGGTWQTWVKPRGSKLVNILLVGSGAGGGGGYQSPTGTIGGGSGGGSGAITRATFPSSLLPDILYILPGIGGSGGLGGSSPTAGSSGQSSYITITPDTSSFTNIILKSGTIPSTGGNPGSNTSGGGTSLGETIGVIGNNIYWVLGSSLSQAGVTSGVGGTVNASNTSAVGTFISSALGGGGTGTGGGISAPQPFITITSAPVNTNGKDGLILTKPTFITMGGTGGGGGTNGGKGGNGGPGAGGGGGGAGTTSAGNGGRGGDGFVIITTSF